MSLKDIFEKIQSTLKEIGANIVNFDLTKLGSEEVVVPVTIFATLIAFLLIYQRTDENFIVKRYLNKYDGIIDRLNKWYLFPIKVLFLLVYLYLCLMLLMLPTLIVTLTFY